MSDVHSRSTLERKKCFPPQEEGLVLKFCPVILMQKIDTQFQVGVNVILNKDPGGI